MQEKKTTKAGSKKAIISIGNKQYIVSEGDIIHIDTVSSIKDTKLILNPLMIIDQKDTSIGQPILSDSSVELEVNLEPIKDDKVTVLKYKPKKRILTKNGHRQRYYSAKVIKII
jgi:ribosomal protein L21